MIKYYSKVLLLQFVFIMFFSSCQTYPKLAKINPSIFEDDILKIEFVIGEKIYYISVTNKTSTEIHFTKKSSIISIYGQSKNLFDNAENWFIPPNSRVIFNTNQTTFFNQNIYTDFVENDYYYQFIGPKYLYQSIISEHHNKIIRMYLSFVINGDEKIYDIPIKIERIMTKDEIKSNIK